MKAQVVLLNLSYSGPRPPSLASGSLRGWALADKDVASAVSIDYCDAFINDDPTTVAARVATKKPRLAGFSCYVWNIAATLAVAHELKRLSPETHLLLGGPEAGGLAQRILESYPEIDFVATGEGEETFRLLLHALFIDAKNISSIPGLAYRGDNQLRIGPEPPLIDVTRAQSPYLDGHIFIPQNPDFMILETSRGCPFACSYCDWGPRKMRYLSLERIEEEFKFALERSPLIVTNDADILMERKRALAIMSAFLRAARGRQALLGIETNPVHLWPEVVDFTAQAPEHFYFAFGLQSISAHVNKLMDRPFNLEALEARLGYFKERCPSAKFHFSLIFGLPGDDLAGYERSLEWALRYEPTRLGLNQCLALPGSRLFQRAQDFGLHLQDGAPHRVLSTPTMPADDIKKALHISSLVTFAHCLPPIREQLMRLRLKQRTDKILPLFAKWATFIKETGIDIEKRRPFDQTSDRYPWDPGELNAEEFRGNPLNMAALLNATQMFARREEGDSAVVNRRPQRIEAC